MENKKIKLFEFLISNTNLSGKWVSIDLLKHLSEDEINNHEYSTRELLLLNIPNLGIFFKCGYNLEIRQKRYLTILVNEWTRIKRDIKIYQIGILEK